MGFVEDEHEEQVVPYFGTPTNVTDTTPFRQLRRRVGYAHAERLAGWYLRMRDMAKQGRVFGEFVTDTVSFVESLDAPVPAASDDSAEFVEWFAERAAIWQAFDEVGLIDIVEGDPSKVDDRFRVSVVDFHETNSPRKSERNNGRRTRMSDEERKAKDRERKRRKREQQKNGGMPSPEPVPQEVHGTSVSAPIQTVQTKQTEQTTTPQPPADVLPIDALRPTGGGGGWDSMSPEERYEAEQAARREVLADVTPTDLDTARTTLSDLLSQILIRSTDADRIAREIVSTDRRRALGQPPRVYPVDVWLRAARVLVRDVTGGRRKVTGDPKGLLISMLPSYVEEGSDGEVLVRDFGPSDAPKGPETYEQAKARIEAYVEERAAAQAAEPQGWAS